MRRGQALAQLLAGRDALRPEDTLGWAPERWRRVTAGLLTPALR